MNARKLGRGLDSLIRKTEERSESRVDDRTEVRQLDPRQIRVNRAQPRVHFDDQALRELSASIKHEGILQPLVVRPDEAGGFELVAGERRLRAALAVGLEVVPVVVQEIDPKRLLRLALIENIQREDLNPIELALAYRELQKAHEWTQEQVAERLGKKRSSIANALRFLELEQPIRDSLSSGQISAGHAKLLLSLGEGEERMEIFGQMSEGGWSVRRLDEAIRELRGEPPAARTASSAEASKKGASRRESPAKPPHIADQEQALARALGTKVEIRAQGDGGKLIIDYYSIDEFEKIRLKLLR
jgi:ParB family chromosome partitioning protein